MIKRLVYICLALFTINCQANDDINRTLDSFHQAATDADYIRYFSLLADDAVFLGTDSTERWTKKQFSAYVKPYFSKGKGWRYVSNKRNISIVDSHPNIAFFDELLLNDNYGLCRGTGVLIKSGGDWKILQYNLSVTVPNSVAKQVVNLISVSANKVK